MYPYAHVDVEPNDIFSVSLNRFDHNGQLDWDPRQREGAAYFRQRPAEGIGECSCKLVYYYYYCYY